MSMSDNTKKMRHIEHGRKMIFSKKVKHTCTWGEEAGHQSKWLFGWHRYHDT